MTKPAVFIASSVEGLRIADAINENLEHDAHCTIWRAGTFKLSSQTVDDLVKKSCTIDFAVFAFTPDDVANIRRHEQPIARDNVVFELGLFIGAIGKERCYIVKPRGVEMHLPSDLLGMNVADYATDRPDDDISSALNYACKLIKDRIGERGSIDRASIAMAPGAAKRAANPPDYKLQDADILFLGQCVKSRVSSPEGQAFFQINNQLAQQSEHAVMMSAIKLERLGYVEKTVAQDAQSYGGEYFAFSATDDGLDIFLKHEDRVIALAMPPAPTARGRRAPPPTKSGFDDMDDDIPF